MINALIHYSDTSLLIIYLSATETLICHRDMEFNSFAQNMIHDFQNTVFKGGLSDLGTKILQKYFKNHPYTPLYTAQVDTRPETQSSFT